MERAIRVLMVDDTVKYHRIDEAAIQDASENEAEVCFASSGEEALEALDLGANEFVEKGESSGVVIACIRSLLRHKWVRDHMEALAQEADKFALDILTQMEAHVATVKSTVERALVASPHKLAPSLESLRSAGEDLSRFYKKSCPHKKMPRTGGSRHQMKREY